VGACSAASVAWGYGQVTLDGGPRRGARQGIEWRRGADTAEASPARKLVDSGTLGELAATAVVLWLDVLREEKWKVSGVRR
jgi:hypothetical protein